MLLDPYKVHRWLNVRKLTPTQLAERTHIDDGDIHRLLTGERVDVNDELGARLAATLSIDAQQIADGAGRELTVIALSAAEVHATRRAIQRDGIHFYNYYSMAGAPGRVAPVILDILCPSDRVPKLNNGHLEPAITVNLGPGDIHGRWAEALDDDSWRVLEANRESDDWIRGDSYVEPSYCPHSYSLASDVPARIISYTAQSELASLFGELNQWTPAAFEEFMRDFSEGQPADLLRSILRRRGFDLASAAHMSEIPLDRLRAWLAADDRALSVQELRRLGERLGFDYRVLLPAPHQYNKIGVTYRSIGESRSSTRSFGSYTFASMACAPHLSGLGGLFMLVHGTEGHQSVLDLVDNTETHYMVLAGDATLVWRDAEGHLDQVQLSADGTAWVAPYVEHGWFGDAAVIKLSSGRHVSYLDQLELTNTFDASGTLRRGWRDQSGWGYDGDATGSS